MGYVTAFQDFLAPNGRIGDGTMGKNPLLYVIGVSELRIVFRTLIPQETPIWIARWMSRNLLRRGEGDAMKNILSLSTL